MVIVRLHFGDIAETESAKSNVDIFDTAHHLACIAIGKVWRHNSKAQSLVFLINFLQKLCFVFKRVIILELISPVPHNSIQTVILVSRALLLRVVPPLREDNSYQKNDWLVKMTLTYHLRAGG